MNNKTTASPRQQIADRIGDALVAEGLDQVYGIIEARQGRYRVLTFCEARITDGEVRIYGAKFIQFRWQTCRHSHAHRGSHVCKSEAEAMQFIADWKQAS